MPFPGTEPIGLKLTRTARTLHRALDCDLAAAGGSLPVWVVMVSLKASQHGAQREIARAVGIEGPTLTHHLARMEAAGLVRRERDPGNRRVQHAELTPEGHALFHRLLDVVLEFDRRLRAGIAPAELAQLDTLLDRLAANVSPGDEDAHHFDCPDG